MRATEKLTPTCCVAHARAHALAAPPARPPRAQEQDKDHNGRIAWDEFLSMCRRVLKLKDRIALELVDCRTDSLVILVACIA